MYNGRMRAKFPVTVHLLFFRADEVLLLLRCNTGYRDGEYSVPAGHLDGNETVMAAAIREAEEETGLRLDPANLAFSSVMHRNDGEERVDFFVHVLKWNGEPVNAEPEKCGELRWARITNLPQNMIPYVGKAIENHQRGAQFEEFGW